MELTIDQAKAADIRSATPKNSPILFPVRQAPLSELTGLNDRGQIAIVREDTNTVLAVHGNRYKLIKNETVMNHLDNMIASMPTLNTDGVRIIDRISYAGGRMLRSYIFPAHQVKIGEGDITELRINVVNSYDGASNFNVSTGGFRTACSNGMVISETYGQYRNRHSSGFSAEFMQDRIAASLRNFEAAGEQWKAWANTRISDERAYQVIDKLCDNVRTHGKLRANLEKFWLTEKGNLGANYWALFNALTYWATHYEVQDRVKENESAVILDREKRVLQIIQQGEFKRIAA